LSSFTPPPPTTTTTTRHASGLLSDRQGGTVHDLVRFNGSGAVVDRSAGHVDLGADLVTTGTLR
jgi:hypothetical protein